MKNLKTLAEINEQIKQENATLEYSWLVDVYSDESYKEATYFFEIRAVAGNEVEVASAEIEKELGTKTKFFKVYKK